MARAYSPVIVKEEDGATPTLSIGGFRLGSPRYDKAPPPAFQYAALRPKPVVPRVPLNLEDIKQWNAESLVRATKKQICLGVADGDALGATTEMMPFVPIDRNWRHSVCGLLVSQQDGHTPPPTSSSSLSSLNRVQSQGSGGKWPRKYAGGGLGDFEPGEYTDDTALSVMLLSSCLDQEVDETEESRRIQLPFNGRYFLNRLHQWAIESKDIGNQTSAIVRMFTASSQKNFWWLPARLFHMQNPDAASNGSLMRNGFMAAMLIDQAELVSMDQTFRHCVATHWHPIPVLCCLLHTYVIRCEHESRLARMKDPQHPWEEWTLASILDWKNQVFLRWAAVTQDLIAQQWLQDTFTSAHMDQFLEQMTCFATNRGLDDHPLRCLRDQVFSRELEDAPKYDEEDETHHQCTFMSMAVYDYDYRKVAGSAVLALATMFWALEWSTHEQGSPLDGSIRPSGWSAVLCSTLEPIHKLIAPGYDMVTFVSLIGSDSDTAAAIAAPALVARFGKPSVVGEQRIATLKRGGFLSATVEQYLGDQPPRPTAEYAPEPASCVPKEDDSTTAGLKRPRAGDSPMSDRLARWISMRASMNAPTPTPAAVPEDRPHESESEREDGRSYGGFYMNLSDSSSSDDGYCTGDEEWGLPCRKSQRCR